MPKPRPIILVAAGTLALAPAPAALAQAGGAQQAAPALPRSVFIQNMDAEFRLRDANSDGKATRAEIEAFERNLARANVRSENLALFRRLDTDRSGALSAEEFAALAPDPGTPDVQSLIHRFDSNGDQAITLIEYRAATLVNFDRLDTDHDGTVTDAEMRAVNVPAQAPVGR